MGSKPEIVLASPAVENQGEQKVQALDPEALSAMLREGGAVSRALAGFEERPGQVEMLQAVVDAFCRDRILAVEAGTGVGKSLAYGIPAAAYARATGERVVISSATINLQEQLVQKDLPLVQRVLGGELRVVLVKGRGNYLCRRRLLDQQRQLPLFDPGGRREVLERLLGWAEAAADGSRTDLPFAVADELWEQVGSDSDACLGRKCPQRGACFFARARRAAESADLLVVNHHLLFADLAVRRAREDWTDRAVLPAFSRVILDEAHEVEDAASAFFGIRWTRAGVARLFARMAAPKKKDAGLLRQLAHEVSESQQGLAMGRAARLVEEADGSVRAMAEEARAAYQTAFDRLAELVLAHAPKAGPAPRLRLTAEVTGSASWAALRESFLQAAQGAQAVSGHVSRLIDRLVDLDPDEGALAEANAWVARAQTLAAQTEELLSDRGDELVRWAECGSRGKPWALLQAAPLDISALMDEALFSKVKTVVLTSATLAVRGDFGFLLTRLGVDRQEATRIESRLVPSPFDFGAQVRLGIPADLPDPREPDFERALPEAVCRVVAASAGRALCLFTAWGLMTRVHELCRDRLTALGLEVFCQGEGPRDRLLEQFRLSARGVLFGTDSFWQGVDVVGSALSNVVITRLPFDVPDEPLVEARLEAVARAGKSPFKELSLPRAVLKLKQGFGRLIRSSGDFGVVAVLDRRLVSKPYGKIFLRSLPPATVVSGTLDEVCAEFNNFFTRRGEPASPPEVVYETREGEGA